MTDDPKPAGSAPEGPAKSDAAADRPATPQPAAKSDEAAKPEAAAKPAVPAAKKPAPKPKTRYLRMIWSPPRFCPRCSRRIRMQWSS